MKYKMLLLICCLLTLGCSSDSAIPEPTQGTGQGTGSGGQGTGGGGQGTGGGGTGGGATTGRLVSRMVRSNPNVTTFNYTYNGDNNLIEFTTETFSGTFLYNQDLISTYIFFGGGAEQSRTNYFYDSENRLDYYEVIPSSGVNAYGDMEYNSNGQVIREALYASLEDLQNQENSYRQRTYMYSDTSDNYTTFRDDTDCEQYYSITYADENKLFFGEAIEKIALVAVVSVGRGNLSSLHTQTLTQLDCTTADPLFLYQRFTNSYDSEGFVTQMNFDRFDENANVVYSENKTFTYETP